MSEFACRDFPDEYCRRCGARLVETVEQGSYNPRTGRREAETWHSCPRYFASPWWVNLLTLGMAAYQHVGHHSHSADDPIRAREWR